MQYIISKELILEQLKKQLTSFFILTEDECKILDKHYDTALDRCEYCFSKNGNKYFKRGEVVIFNPYISTQYVIFLYYFGNTIFIAEHNHRCLCDKLYYLNKAMNAIDLLYSVEMPKFFMCEHPVGTVIGRGKIGEGFLIYQNCTVGGVILKNEEIVYPCIGENVRLYANSMILGNCIIGDNVNIGAGAVVKNQNIPSNSNVFGESPNLIIKVIK